MQKMASEREQFFQFPRKPWYNHMLGAIDRNLSSDFNFKLLRSAEVTDINQHKSVFVNKATH